MSLWGIGNLILIIIVVPVLVALLNRLLAALERIRGASQDALDGGVALIGELDTTPALLDKTDDVINEVANGAVRYAGPVSKLLG
jgi:preprotein translocase subunit SecY